MQISCECVMGYINCMLICEKCQGEIKYEYVCGNIPIIVVFFLLLFVFTYHFHFPFFIYSYFVVFFLRQRLCFNFFCLFFNLSIDGIRKYKHTHYLLHTRKQTNKRKATITTNKTTRMKTRLTRVRSESRGEP